MTTETRGADVGAPVVAPAPTAIEVVGVSTTSFSAATTDGVATASALLARAGGESVVCRFEVIEMSGPVADGRRTGYHIRLRVTVPDGRTERRRP